MSDETLKKYEPEFPHGEHDDCRVLTALTLDHLPRDGSLGQTRRFRHGADVWQPEDRSDRIYFLARGQIAIIASSVDGHEIVLSVIEPREPFGELCFCGGDHAYRRTTARATVESEIVEVNLTDFVNYLQQNRDVLAAFLFTFCIRLAHAERRIEILSYRGAEERLGMLLLHLASARSGRSDGQSEEVKLSVTHEELARMAAMSRQQVTITMGRLRRAGLVRYERNRPLVVKADALAIYLSNKKSAQD
ncbi:MAG: Crp/Fnr family transcriptional regulator [Pyrinomonadaceae bacterium]|nr:Crp/Fnr family transcriptional regulator [Pyrinomonadaceae bacterium]